MSIQPVNYYSMDSDTTAIELSGQLYHSVVFEILLNGNYKENKAKLLLRYFDLDFIKVLQLFNLPKITVALALCRNQQLGCLRVHVLGYAIAHDDYFHLCHQMKGMCDVVGKSRVSVTLHCPSKLSLVSLDGPGSLFERLYVPVRLTRIQFQPKYESPVWRLYDIDCKVVVCHDPHTECPYEQFENASYQEAERLLMLLPDKSWPVLYFPTEIEQNRCRQFESSVTGFGFRIERAEVLRVGGPQTNGSVSYSFFKQHTDSLKLVQMGNRAIRDWVNQFRSRDRDSGLFADINRKLRKCCIHLKNEHDPLQTVLVSNRRHVLPVFYALRNEMRKKKATLIARSLIDLYAPAEAILDEAAVTAQLPCRMTFQTIVYCAYQSIPLLTKQGCFWQNIGLGWQWIFKAMTCDQHMWDHVYYVQQQFFPMLRGKDHLYAWDPFVNQWCEMDEEACVSVFQEIFKHLTYFEGYSSVSDKVMTKLKPIVDRRMATMAKQKFQVVSKYTPLKGPAPPKTFDELEQLYGQNVPEYHLFNLNLIANDETDTRNMESDV